MTQLLEDLIVEIEDSQLTMNEETNDELGSEAKERVRQYDELHFKDKLAENGWYVIFYSQRNAHNNLVFNFRCEILSKEFIRLSNSLPTNEEGHAFVEASGKSLLAMDDLCLFKLQKNNQLYKSLYALEAYYKNLSHDDDYYDPPHQLMNELTNSYDPVLE